MGCPGAWAHVLGALREDSVSIPGHTPPSVAVPCYNEASRLDRAGLTSLAASGIDLILVDDGSTDGTGEILDDLAASIPHAQVVHLNANQGKAEAVRVGMLLAAHQGAAVVGYLDADLSTPPDEYLRVLAQLEADATVQVALASRVALLGRQIERRAHRHYLGRVFATMASAALGLRVYDTQCGAKVFRVSPRLLAALESPFRARWAFDVELLGRLLVGSPGLPGLLEREVLEVPLLRWHDVSGSHLRAPQMARALLDLGGVAWDVRRGHRPCGRVPNAAPGCLEEP